RNVDGPGRAWDDRVRVRNGRAAGRAEHHGRRVDGRAADMAHDGQTRKRSRAHLAWPAVLARDRALPAQIRQHISSEPRHPAQRAVPPEEIQGPDDKGWRVPASLRGQPERARPAPDAGSAADTGTAGANARPGPAEGPDRNPA